MSDRSVSVYEASREAEQKFDYFVTGLTGALFAYIGQTYTPRELALGASSLEPLALIFLALSFFIGLKRIETVTLVMSLNHQMLDAQEKAGEAARALSEGFSSGVNVLSGHVVNSEQLQQRRLRMMETAKEIGHVIERISGQTHRLYRYRNHFLLGGFAAIVLGKVFQPYYL